MIAVRLKRMYVLFVIEVAAGCTSSGYLRTRTAPGPPSVCTTWSWTSPPGSARPGRVMMLAKPGLARGRKWRCCWCSDEGRDAAAAPGTEAGLSRLGRTGGPDLAAMAAADGSAGYAGDQ